MVSYDYYRIFYYVGKYGSFTRAAKILMNNQPNITRSMNNLEAELGCKLFFRSRKGISLTPEGERLFLHVQSAQEQLQIGESEILASKTLQNGYLSLAVSDIALHSFILPILHKYCDTYPGIRIRVMNYSTTQAVTALERGIAELAIVTAPTGVVSPMQESSVRSFQNVLIAGKHFAALAKDEISLKDLMQYPLICLGQDTKTYEFYDSFFAANGLLLDPSIEAATTDQILPMVIYGLGLGFVPGNLPRNRWRRGMLWKSDSKSTSPHGPSVSSATKADR